MFFFLLDDLYICENLEKDRKRIGKQGICKNNKEIKKEIFTEG